MGGTGDFSVYHKIWGHYQPLNSFMGTDLSDGLCHEYGLW